MDRRDFLRLCASAGALLAAGPHVFAADAAPRHYARVRLVAEDGTALRADGLEIGRNYVFHYPFAATPCFLLNLGRPTAAPTSLTTESGRRYRWSGGVGPHRSIVAYSAICAHQMAHPTRQVSFIAYRHGPGATAGKAAPGVITCCANNSVYDPAQGARVLSGPAGQPLAAILLEHRAADDALFAVGTFGGEMFDAFFEQFAERLGLEYGSALKARQPVTATAVVLPLERFSATQMNC